ncbi:KpsF/GutQ family sugar-phosphate isomerase [Haliangium ochraceum]|uniref:KpsF/GutQ family protein n=1 Tax=Haliangium ochraceum (strain DSM 14365 / JCM 11303 / SMP-2) TaxID=502025 RepID=D0LJS5_HALO1|nr:KpsF/GutQ family sugar-phosphate isomerase [Haliangium ochraceum]ACY18432.1 KpsF/GutQ family protein [Haliangium ochraceum DSM 14365]
MLNLKADTSSVVHASPNLESRDARVEQAREVFREQAAAIADLGQRIDASFTRAIELLRTTPGHVVICGMGKSGLIGQKIAATLASTGTPSFFVHPAEAYHGDLGMITAQNTVMLLSYSGETEEVVRLLPHLQRMRVPLIGLVGRLDSTLARQVDVALDVSVEREACPNNLAPTSSTLAALAMGDALAVSLIHERKFGPHDFARFHPGGSLGRRLCCNVADLMRIAPLPLLRPQDALREAVLTLAQGRFGIAVVVDAARKPLGVITEADLRTTLDAAEQPLAMPVSMIMRRELPVIEANARINDAEQVALRLGTEVLIATDENDKVVGILDLRAA